MLGVPVTDLEDVPLCCRIISPTIPCHADRTNHTTWCAIPLRARTMTGAQLARGKHVAGHSRWQDQPTMRSIWMQTIGTTLIAAKRCSLVRMLTPAQGSRSAHALLYLATVRDDWRQQEHRQIPAAYCYGSSAVPGRPEL